MIKTTIYETIKCLFRYTLNLTSFKTKLVCFILISGFFNLPSSFGMSCSEVLVNGFSTEDLARLKKDLNPENAGFALLNSSHFFEKDFVTELHEWARSEIRDLEENSLPGYPVTHENVLAFHRSQIEFLLDSRIVKYVEYVEKVVNQALPEDETVEATKILFFVDGTPVDTWHRDGGALYLNSITNLAGRGTRVATIKVPVYVSNFEPQASQVVEIYPGQSVVMSTHKRSYDVPEVVPTYHSGPVFQPSDLKTGRLSLFIGFKNIESL